MAQAAAGSARAAGAETPVSGARFSLGAEPRAVTALRRALLGTALDLPVPVSVPDQAAADRTATYRAMEVAKSAFLEAMRGHGIPLKTAEYIVHRADELLNDLHDDY